MNCPNCNGEGCCMCRIHPSPIPAHAPEMLGYIQERTGIDAADMPQAIGRMVHEIVRLRCAYGAMEEQRDIYRDALYQNARGVILAEDNHV